jgi:acid stress-induced BolA-like protein IbaG/YrbA
LDTGTIHHAIQAALPDAHVEVRGDDGVHFEALVVSDRFAGLPPLARHRRVYAALGDLVGGAIHALSLRTLTPEEHERNP